jgi:HEXXH motif-containing protein
MTPSAVLNPAYDFMPCPDRAGLIDRRMRLQLQHSLQYLQQCAAEQLALTLPGLIQVVAGMEQGLRYPASTFGLYYELASALLDGNQAQALGLDQELAAEVAFDDDDIHVLTLDDIPNPANRARYQRLMNTDPSAPLKIVSTQASQGETFKRFYQDSLERLSKTDPVIYNEVKGIVRDVILVAGDASQTYQFAGGSSYMLWGALFINASMHGDFPAIAEAIAHESAHSLLFGFTIDEPLVENPDDDKFASPLRVDPRPMDGIYHATYVSARMHLAMHRLLATDSLSLDERAWSQKAMDEDAENFRKGEATVASSAQLTETGLALMDGARAYMAPFLAR